MKKDFRTSRNHQNQALDNRIFSWEKPRGHLTAATRSTRFVSFRHRFEYYLNDLCLLACHFSLIVSPPANFDQKLRVKLTLTTAEAASSTTTTWATTTTSATWPTEAATTSATRAAALATLAGKVPRPVTFVTHCTAHFPPTSSFCKPRYIINTQFRYSVHTQQWSTKERDARTIYRHFRQRRTPSHPPLIIFQNVCQSTIDSHQPQASNSYLFRSSLQSNMATPKIDNFQR